MKQIKELVHKSWADSVDSIYDLHVLANALQKNPKAILRTQQQLMAIAYVCFQRDEMEFYNALNRAVIILEAFMVNSEQRRKEAL